MHYNFCRIHQTSRVTQAMEAGIAGLDNGRNRGYLALIFGRLWFSLQRVKLVMRILKLKTPVLALFLAGIALASSVLLFQAVQFELRPGTSIDAFDWLFMSFYAPASLAAFLCEPISNYEKGLPHAQGFPFWFMFAMIQWYLIFLVGIGIYRHFRKKRGKDEPAV